MSPIPVTLPQAISTVGRQAAGRIPITVRLANSTVDRHITNRIAGLSWRNVAPGGFGPAQFSLQSPIDVSDPLLAPFTRMYVYDGRNGNVLWEGRLTMPGRSVGDQGQVWALSGSGPAAHTLDQSEVLIYLDTRLDQWQKDILGASLIPATASVQATTYPTGTTDGLLCQFADNTDLTSSPSLRVQAGYDWDTGFTSTNFAVESAVGVSPTYSVIVNGPTADIAGGSVSAFVVDDFAGGKDIAALLLRRTTGATT